MAKTLLSTKFYIPPTRPEHVPRPRLIERLNESLSRKLALISTPAGFGKSTLLSQWVSAYPHPISWLSLDSNDDDPFRFLTYLVGAFQKIDSNIGQEALEILNSSQSPPYEMILTLLINEIAGIPKNFTLILDDYHFINDEQIHKIISFVLDNMPSTMHLVVSTRLDPPLPLARMRANRELVEIRSKDLRLTPEETTSLLNGVLGHKFTAREIQSLDEYIEGWVAGLQLFVLSVQGREDVSGFMETFTGNNRFVLDYLIEEVLARQPSEIRDFLLKTSILERMNASLCNAVLEMDDGHRILTHLDQSNAFLIPLDNERKWYRYHHLFTDLLQNQMTRLYPSQISDLHIRASNWYDREGLYTEAISHALIGEDFDRAASLYEKYGLTVMSKNLANWFDLLPKEVIGNRPWLCLLMAWLHYSVGTRPRAAEFLQMAERSIGQVPSSNVSPVSHSLSVFEQQRLKGAIAAIRAHILIVQMDFKGVLEQVNRAFEHLPEEDPWRTTAMVAQGLAYWALGDRYQSEETFTYASESFMERHNWDGIVSSLCYKGIMQIKQGHLQSALDTYMEALNFASKPDGTKILFTSIPYLRIGDLTREWNDLSRAQEFIHKGIDLAKKLNHPDVLIEAHICMARLQIARKNQAGTFTALNNAERILSNFQVDPWYLGWLDECWLRYRLSLGDLTAADSLVKKRGLKIEGAFSYYHDLHHINLARILVAQGIKNPSEPYLDQARVLLNRLQEAAEKAGWVHETIKILILMGLMFWASSKKERVVEVLLQALALAESGGYVRIFIDEGAPMEEMLAYLLSQKKGGVKIDPHIAVYADKLLKNMRNKISETIPLVSSGMSAMVEALSDRELEVLHYLNTHLTSTEIARELNISANTVRFHIKNIYGKLNVNRRTGAVDRAKELGFL